MGAPFLDVTGGLDVIRPDLVYLRHRLSRDERARDLAKLATTLITEWTEVYTAQLAHWDAQLEAQGDVTIADEALDARVDAVDNDLRTVVKGDREDPRYRVYIAEGASDLKRPVLGDELETLRDWQRTLATEEDATLRKHHKGLSAEITAADAALEARAAADQKNAVFRATGVYAKYVQKVVATRDRIWAELEGRRTKSVNEGLPRDWANRFFRPKPQAALSEAERAARAAERAREKQAREEAARKRKELTEKLRETKKELAALAKKPKKTKG